MTRRKSNKRALTLSLLSLLLCMAMLVGSTFAWFTDNATTAVNTIQAGTLDIGLYDNDEIFTKDTSLEGKSLTFAKAADAPEGEAVLFEPGAKYSLQQAWLYNAGNLHAKYKVVVSGIDGNSELAKVLDVYVNGNKVDTLANLVAGGGIVKENTIGPKAVDTFGTIELMMQTEANNDYQGLSLSGISITVMATQAPVEFDSTTDKYDEDAEYDEKGATSKPWDNGEADKWDDATTEEVPDEEDGTIVIKTAEEFAAFAADVNDGETYEGKTVKLAQNISLEDHAWTPINNFAGTFDGQWHYVSNLTTNLFGTVNGTVTKLHVSNVDITNTAKNGGNGFIKTVAAGGLIDNCKVSEVDIQWADGISDMTDGFGGVISDVRAGATVQDCEFTDIAVTTYAKTKRTGGVFDGISGTVKDCVVSNVSFTVADNYSGDAYTTSYAGGFAAVVNGGAVVEGCTINNMVAFADEAFNFGGIFGKAYVAGQTGDITLKNINVNGLTMTIGNTVVNYSTYTNIGGFIGQVDSRSNAMSLNVDNCHIGGLNMTLASISTSESPAAGFISCINGNANITNCSVAGKIDGTDDSFGIGGFLGDIGGHGCPADGYTVNIKDCTADVAITGNDNIFVGGFVGYAGSYRKDITLSLNFTNCEATDSFYGQVATGTNEASTFTNCKVDGAAFTA